ncbi:hypothetical protein, partial [Cereibacter sediminicola]|uniref:hypothetical protein n=1 Tax=Cereibacter sediminicola TaxID=2584941 RepID=UPI0011A64138
MKNVQMVRGKWRARLTVPEELRGLVGKRELVADLPGDKNDRDRRALAVLNGFHAILDDAREALAAQRPTLSTAAKAHYQAELDADDLGRRARTSGLEDDERRSRSVYANRLRLVAAGKASPEEAEALIGFGADELHRKGQAPDTSRADLLRALAEVQLEALARFEERDAGQVKPSEPRSELLTAPDPETTRTADVGATGGLLLSQALAGFHRERTAGGRTLAPKTMEEHGLAVRMFSEFMGGDMPVKTIMKRDVIAYKQALLETPNRYTMRFRGLTLPQAIKANKKRSEPFATLQPKTINMKWLSHLSTVLQWASNNGHVEANPALGIRVDTGSKVHREATRLPFTRDELKQIFGHPLFADPGEYGLNQWATLIMLYTGVRNSSEMSLVLPPFHRTLRRLRFGLR